MISQLIRCLSCVQGFDEPTKAELELLQARPTARVNTRVPRTTPALPVEVFTEPDASSCCFNVLGRESNTELIQAEDSTLPSERRSRRSCTLPIDIDTESDGDTESILSFPVTVSKSDIWQSEALTWQSDALNMSGYISDFTFTDAANQGESEPSLICGASEFKAAYEQMSYFENGQDSIPTLSLDSFKEDALESHESTVPSVDMFCDEKHWCEVREVTGRSSDRLKMARAVASKTFSSTRIPALGKQCQVKRHRGDSKHFTESDSTLYYLRKSKHVFGLLCTSHGESDGKFM